VIVYFGQFHEKYTISPNVCVTYVQGKNYVSTLAKNGLGYILGDFLTNSSGHPA
jgi:hypothetical protein